MTAETCNECVCVYVHIPNRRSFGSPQSVATPRPIGQFGLGLNLSSLLPLGHLYPRTVCRGREGTRTGTDSVLPPALLSNPNTPIYESNFPFWGNETLESCKLQVRLAAVLHRIQNTWLLFCRFRKVFYLLFLLLLLLLLLIKRAAHRARHGQSLPGISIPSGLSGVWLFIFRTLNTTHDRAASCRRAAALVYAQPRFP